MMTAATRFDRCPRAGLLRVVCLGLMASGLVGVLGGCSSSRVSPETPPTTLSVPIGGYLTAFDATREALRDRGFQLDRIDAAAGVITTRPRGSAGLLAPWDTAQSTFKQERDEMLQPTQRRVRVTFTPLDGSEALESPDGPMEARVRVDLDRVYRSNWRPSAVSVRLSSFAVDPDRVERGLGGRFAVPDGRDPALEERIARDIRERIAPSR